MAERAGSSVLAIVGHVAPDRVFIFTAHLARVRGGVDGVMVADGAHTTVLADVSLLQNLSVLRGPVVGRHLQPAGVQ